jgi:hypothetical protein
MLEWTVLSPRSRPEQAGLIPAFINDTDPRPLHEQINERYAHGGGWSPLPDFKLDPTTLQLSYPGDPPLKPLYWTRVRGEEFVIYEHGFCIIRRGAEFEVARLD